jgi:hypothetical protein
LLWFLGGSGVNYLLISMPFKWLRANTGLTIEQTAAASMATSALFFFCWNYFVNFRTDSRKRDALWRYVVAVCVMWTLSTTLLAFLKRYNANMHFELGRFALDLDVIATQFFLAGIKFPIYHFWAFPVESTKSIASQGWKITRPSPTSRRLPPRKNTSKASTLMCKRQGRRPVPSQPGAKRGTSDAPG